MGAQVRVLPWRAYALTGGYADATGYLLARTFTGHVTGTWCFWRSRSSIRIGRRSATAFAILVFMAATGVGFRIVRFGTLRSPWILFLPQTLLMGTVPLPLVRGSQIPNLWPVAALCLALGLGNGAITSAGGDSLHATFVSGDVTSLIKLLFQGGAGDSTNPAEHNAAKPASLKRAVLFGVLLGFAGGRIARVC